MMRYIIIRFIKFFLIKPFMSPIWAAYIIYRCKPYGGIKKDKPKFSIFILNHTRYKPDLDEINKSPEVQLLVFPERLQNIMNRVCMSAHYKRYDYFKQENASILADRKKLNSFLVRIFKALRKRIENIGFLTCSFYYVQDQEWDKAAVRTRVPFFAIYKENLKYEVRYEYTKGLYQKNNFCFEGSKLFVFDHTSKDVLSRANVCPLEKISVVGVPRIDKIYHDIMNGSLGNIKKRVTLFSFRHAIAGVLMAKKGDFEDGFSKDNTKGVVDLFRGVHGAIAEMAQVYPGWEFIIKPKWIARQKDRIIREVLIGSKINLSTIKNIKITSDIHAQELIKSSAVIVGINSTTLLEARLFKRPTIIPFFAEAAGELKKEVYFKDYFDDFLIADSKGSLKSLLKQHIESEKRYLMPPISKKMISRYLGYFDGRNGRRVVEQMASSFFGDSE